MVNSLVKRNLHNSSGFVLSPFIGFDNIFDTFNDFFDIDVKERLNLNNFNKFPPYNLVQTDNGYALEVAVAGYDKKDISITNDNGNLVIEANKVDEEQEEKDAYLHRGIAKRSFKLLYNLAEDVKIDGAEMKDGLLKITMTKLNPEVKELEKIEIK